MARDRLLPLSFSQQRLWFLHLLNPDSAAYNIALAFTLDGPLDVELLRRMFNEIFRRHESLRTSFATVEGEPVQIISPQVDFELPVVDLRELPVETRQAAAARLAEEEALRPFDLSKDVLLRVTLARLAEEQHIAMFTMHHIISDGWSMGVLVHEIAALYESYRKGESSPLAALPIQYADFAVWQRKWLQGEVLEEQLSYWRRSWLRVERYCSCPLTGPAAVQT